MIILGILLVNIIGLNTVSHYLSVVLLKFMGPQYLAIQTRLGKKAI